MKRTIKCIAFLAALTLCIALFPFSARATETTGNFNAEEQFLSEHGEDYWKNIAQANANNATLRGFFSEDSYGEPIYPDFIGGIYYTDAGNMVLQIVEKYTSKDAALYNRVKKFAEQANGLIVENVVFSANELKATMDTLNTMFLADKRPEACGNVDLFAEDTINNRVEVHLSVFNETEIALFKREILDSPSLAFVKSDGKVVTLFNEIEPQPAIVQPQRDNARIIMLIGSSVGLLVVMSIFFLLRRKRHAHTLRDS